jgi:hypothetical protein
MKHIFITIVVAALPLSSIFAQQVDVAFIATVDEPTFLPRNQTPKTT